MTRVLIVDDQAVVCEGLRVMLNAAPTIEVVGVAYTGAEALKLIPDLKPTLVLLDLKMPVMNGIHTTRAIREQFPEIKVLILTTYADDEWLFDAIRVGADGYILKDSRREDIVEAVMGTAAGRTHIDPAVAGRLFNYVQNGTAPESAIISNFSEREQEILKLVAHGLTNADIAEQLHLAEGTVRNYVSTILTKLDVKDRTQAAALAWRCGLAGG
jgi:DNA-binding NarL/FixJ family response regulator